jgi:hypothetical protein
LGRKRILPLSPIHCGTTEALVSIHAAAGGSILGRRLPVT